MGRPRQYDRDRTTTAVRFDAATLEALRETAEEIGVSVNWLVNRAVTEHLADMVLPVKMARHDKAPE